MKRSDYPDGWVIFTLTIKVVRAGGRCECTGECGLHGGANHVSRCIEKHGEKAHFAKGLVVLTTAHLCNCLPICKEPNHVRAMCQRCHLRVDRFKHAAARMKTQATRAPSQTDGSRAAFPASEQNS